MIGISNSMDRILNIHEEDLPLYTPMTLKDIREKSLSDIAVDPVLEKIDDIQKEGRHLQNLDATGPRDIPEDLHQKNLGIALVIEEDANGSENLLRNVRTGDVCLQRMLI